MRSSPPCLASLAALGALLLLGTLTASSDDLGRNGRTLAYRCGELITGRVSPWPGSFYTVPLAQAVGAVVVLAAIGLWALAHRPPSGPDHASDSAERHRSASLIIAAVGLARAYKQLESDGYVTTRRGAGTRIAPRDVAPTGNAPSGEWATELLARAAREYAAMAASSGHSLSDAIEALEKAWGPPARRRSRHDDERQL